MPDRGRARAAAPPRAEHTYGGADGGLRAARGGRRPPRAGALLAAAALLGLGLLGPEAAETAEKPRPRPRPKKAAERVAPAPIETSAVWRESEVFSPEQLVALEPILRTSTCTKAKGGCTYLASGRPGSEASFDFRLIPWKVSPHAGYLVHNDRCAPGGCDQGLFVHVGGRWRLVVELFGMLERLSSVSHGFHDLVAHPRGQAPVRLVWDGEAYREAGR